MRHNYRYRVKRALLDRGLTQVWLAEEVSKMTGLKNDPRYLSKVIGGARSSDRMIAAINEILFIK